MLNDLVMEYLSLSDKMRKGYKDSLELRARHGMKLFSGYHPSYPKLSRQYTEKYPEHIETLTIKRIWILFQDIG